LGLRHANSSKNQREPPILAPSHVTFLQHATHARDHWTSVENAQALFMLNSSQQKEGINFKPLG